MPRDALPTHVLPSVVAANWHADTEAMGIPMLQMLLFVDISWKERVGVFVGAWVGVAVGFWVGAVVGVWVGV